MLEIALDSGGRHRLLATLDQGEWRWTLHHGSGAKRSALDEALKEGLAFEASADRLTVVLEGGLRLVTLSAEGGTPRIEAQHVLSPIESRYFAENRAILPGSERAALAAVDVSRLPRTDLHTHFAGCVRASALVEIGLAADVAFPAHLLAAIGVHAGAVNAVGAVGAQSADVPLRSLSGSMIARLVDQIAIPIDRRVPFAEMERIYRLRAPITKHPATFLAQLAQIADDYREMGVAYAELSLGDVVDTDRLRAIHEALPDIERRSGVELRFLAAFSRHDDYEWDLDLIERIEDLAESGYIAGVDFMGHETNSTRAFERQLRAIAAWADRVRPGFAIRVHAGENPAHPENVRVALDAVKDRDVQLRIGHGLYGVDADTLERLAATGTIVEFNLNSNFALNNLQSGRQAPIERYAKAGVPIVLGTDGYGIYQTSIALEARAARLFGLDASDFDRIRASEDRYLERRRAGDAKGTKPVRGYAVPEARAHAHYSPEVGKQKAEAAAERDQTLGARLASLAIPLLDERALAAFLEDKQVLSFAGAWKKSWDLVSLPMRARIEAEVEALLVALAPERTVLVTGGTNYGVENVVGRAARRHGLTVLGALVKETPPDALEAGAMTHAFLVAEKLHGKAAGLYRLMKEHDGVCVFIGGGHIVSDEIQTAINLRLRYLLMDGPEGASTEHARQQPGHAFRTAAEVLEVLADPVGGQRRVRDNLPFWYQGPNPTVDAVVFRKRGTGREILLIQRDIDAPSEGGKWALPGGFVRAEAPPGGPWTKGRETEEQACVRELHEETGLDLEPLQAALLRLGVYEGPGRDPRDTEKAWSRTTAFVIELEGALAEAAIAGGDDAFDARWFPLERLPRRLAFDHARIIEDAVASQVSRAYDGRGR